MSINRDPLISVVMPVFNGGEYLLTAVASIIEQTQTDWELICVNDGSSDHSGALLDWLAGQDQRIRVIHQPNAGIVAALNRGCAAAVAPLICRMDCDDIAMPNRLEKQAAYLRAHPTCIVVGGAILEIDEDGDPLAVSRLPYNHAEIVAGLMQRRTGHFHPTTMFRAEAFEAVGGYRERFQWIEDHDLWLRMAQRGQLANMRNVLLCYRQHARSICWQRSSQQRDLMNELMREAYRARGQQAPEQCMADAATARAPAGPGKWARAAAKGGYPHSVAKHLTRLLQSDARVGYKARMLAEASLRLIGGCTRRLLLGGSPRIPQFLNWQTRLADDTPSAKHSQAA